MALGIAIFLELAGGVLFMVGSPLGSCFLVRALSGIMTYYQAAITDPGPHTIYHMRLTVAPLVSCGQSASSGRRSSRMQLPCSVVSSHCVGETEDDGAAVMQATFCILVTPIMHNFWTLKEGSQEQLVDM